MQDEHGWHLIPGQFTKSHESRQNAEPLDIDSSAKRYPGNDNPDATVQQDKSLPTNNGSIQGDSSISNLRRKRDSIAEPANRAKIPRLGSGQTWSPRTRLEPMPVGNRHSTLASAPDPIGSQANPVVLDLTPSPEKPRRNAPAPRKNGSKLKFYAVSRGRVPGIYTTWDEAKRQVDGFSKALYKSFTTQAEAQTYISANGVTGPACSSVAYQQTAGDPRSLSLGEKSYSVSASVHNPLESCERSPLEAPTSSYNAALENLHMDEPLACANPADLASLGTAKNTGLASLETAKNLAIAPTLPGDPPLCKEQADLVELILRGKNVFYTGSAGCGKSTVLKVIRERLRQAGKHVVVVAPTGRAALNVNGVTTWNFMGWVPSHHKRPIKDLTSKIPKAVWKRIDEADVLIFDEISMVENLHFERINRYMQVARHRHQRGEGDGELKAFGGVQVIACGDFTQLPPVKPFGHCFDCGHELETVVSSVRYKCPKSKCGNVYLDKDKWAFRSDAWEQCKFVHVNLTKIHRQSDLEFISLLQKLRIGDRLSQDELRRLTSHPTPLITPKSNAVKIYGSRAEVHQENERRYQELRSAERLYNCLDDFQWNKEHIELRGKGRMDDRGRLLEFEEKEHRYSSILKLKFRMAVILLANLDVRSGLVNGAQGTIIGFKKHSATSLSSKVDGKSQGDYADYKDEQIRRYAEQAGSPLWPEVEFSNGVRCVIHPDCSINEYGYEKPYTKLSRTQLPLTAGYAITIHKSQGMTLDKVEVDLKSNFEAGQAYVALSRARSLDGLKVRNFTVQLPSDPQVREFLASDKFRTTSQSGKTEFDPTDGAIWID